MADDNQDLKPFGGEHRALTTADLDEIAEYVGKKNKPKRSSSSSSSKSKSSGRKSK